MAKVPFSKLKCKINDSVKEVQLTDDIVIEVKQYLPIQEKLELIGKVIELAHQEDFDYSNPLKINAYTDLEILFAYTNLSFTDKQKEDLPKMYDSLFSSGTITLIKNNIPEEEIVILTNSIEKTLSAIYQYQHSVLGILDAMKTDYNHMKLDIDDLNESISNPELLALVKDLLTKIN